MKVQISETTARGLLVACSWAEDEWESFCYRATNHPSDGYTREDVQRAATNVRAWREARHHLEKAMGFVDPTPIVEPLDGLSLAALPGED